MFSVSPDGQIKIHEWIHGRGVFSETVFPAKDLFLCIHS